MTKLIAELEKLENFLEKYMKVMKDKVNHYDEKLKNKEEQTEFQTQKQGLETKIEKVKPILAQLYLDKSKIETSGAGSNQGKAVGTASGVGIGAAGGAAAGA